MSERCPICDSYNCRCSDSRLRGYQQDHLFDNPLGHPLRVWAQNDRNERVECELRDRRVREQQEEEDRQRQRHADRQRREAEHQRALNEEYEREQEERHQQELEYAQDPVECSLCGKTTAQYCSTLACPECHKSITFEDCIAGRTVA